MAGSGSESVSAAVALPSTSIFSDCATVDLAKPLFLQRIDQAVRLDSFLEHVQKQFEPLSSSDDSADNQSDTETAPGFQKVNGILSSRQERRSDRMKLYNFNKLKKSRKWIKNILLSDSSDSDDETSGVDIQRMLRIHKLKTNTAKQLALKPELRQYQYISTGILSNQDKFHEHQKAVLGHKKKTKDKKSDKKKSKSKKRKMEKEEDYILSEQETALIREAIKMEESINLTAAGGGSEGGGEMGLVSSATPTTSAAPSSSGGSGKPKKKTQNPLALEASMNAKRKRLWVAICKKEISRTQKQIFAAHKEVLTNAKKLAVNCQRECRKGALLSQKVVKDTPSMSRRLTKEMLLYWKRYEKVEKEHRKRAEKEAQEQLRIDIELREAKRQQRKLNFLITQTELYAHFMSRKMRSTEMGIDETEQKILNQLDETKTQPKIQIKEELTSDNVVASTREDDYDADYLKAQALFNAQQAYKSHQDKVNVFGETRNPILPEVNESFNENFRLTDPSLIAEMEHPQPSLFEGKLKTYQLKGMNWLNNLYDKGINGILADEMGLGKTVQTIAFLALLAEAQDIWGPFLVIAPASTLHNWQQELSRFVPKFKVLPYWGNTSDRKVLRKFWNSKDELHSEESPYHVLVTSYQLVVQDIKYFQRIKWQYMVLDEAQAIKSTSSVRWKLLLGFRCRNRLLLTGTPIQNSMAELWALLHFIMPTLFDSHDEFNEWFSKDIESHAENKSAIDEKHLSRLHMILKPFMLRRIKKDVENELSDKIEILVSCHLTKRQLALYYNLRSKISIDDLLQSSYGSSGNSSLQSATSSLMNLVMQFRKVCNHPDLFERREPISPFHLKLDTYQMPRTLFNQSTTLNALEVPATPAFLNIFNSHHIHDSLFDNNSETKSSPVKSAFSFLRFCDLSPSDVNRIATHGIISRWLENYLQNLVCKKLYHQSVWNDKSTCGDQSKRFMFFVSETRASHPLQLSSDSGPLNGNLVVVRPCGPPLYSLVKRTDSSNQSSQPNVLLRDTDECKDAELTLGLAAPKVLFSPVEKVSANPIDLYTVDPAIRSRLFCLSNLLPFGCRPSMNSNANRDLSVLLKGPQEWFHPTRNNFISDPIGGILALHPPQGLSQIAMPYKDAIIMDSGKLRVLDVLLTRLKNEGHRVLIYSQMTRMIDILEDYMCHRKHTYMRLDGSSKISDRRDMVADFQSRSDIFVFLLSTRAGGLGINLTAADTVIFYDSDWNPTVDQQAMDRAHRLGQTKQVTVYRLICKDSIEERILQRAKEKSEIQRMVISGGHFKPDTLKPKEVVSLLLDDKELERKFNQRQEERKVSDDPSNKEVKKRKKERSLEKKIVTKKKKTSVTDEENVVTNHSLLDYQQSLEVDSVQSNDSFAPPSPYSEHSVGSSSILAQDDSSSESPLVVDDVNPKMSPIPVPFFSLTGAGWSTLDGPLGGAVSPLSGGSSFSLQAAVKRAGTRSRGRPRGSTRRGLVTTTTRGVKTNTLATAAAELAGAQAGKSAVFAAYGYSLPSSSNVVAPAVSTPSVASPSSTSSSPAAPSMTNSKN